MFVGQSRSMIQANDFDGARRLGRRSLLLSIVAIAVGLTIILYLAITGKYSNHKHNAILYHTNPHKEHISYTTSIYHVTLVLFSFCVPQGADVM